MKNLTGTYALHIAIGMALVAMVFCVFTDADRYDFLFPVIFFTFAAFALFGSWLSAHRSPEREQRRTILGGAVLCGIFVCFGILAVVSDWLGLI